MRVLGSAMPVPRPAVTTPCAALRPVPDVGRGQRTGSDRRQALGARGSPTPLTVIGTHPSGMPPGPRSRSAAAPSLGRGRLDPARPGAQVDWRAVGSDRAALRQFLRLTRRRALRCAPGAVAAAAGRLDSAPTPRKSALAHDVADHVVDGGHLHPLLERVMVVIAVAEP